MPLLLLVIFLPLLEIAGFIIIGGKIGVGWSLLWIITDVIVGMMILSTMGGNILRSAQKSIDKKDDYPFEELFDGFCILTGAVLLIFPGFISDFLALPLLIPPVRHWIFLYLKYKHNSVLNELSKKSQGFTYWYYEERTGGTTKTIEGEFINTDENKKLH